jgi:hypothetical protein
MHSLLCAAALHLYIVGKGSSFSIVYHKAQAVAAINAALSDPELGISDANIAAVFNLLCVEESLLMPFFHDESWGEAEGPNQRMIHLNGLRRMVELRGGLRAIRTHRVLQAFILWCAQLRVVFPNGIAMLTEHTGIARHTPLLLSRPRTSPPSIRLTRLETQTRPRIARASRRTSSTSAELPTSENP